MHAVKLVGIEWHFCCLQSWEEEIMNPSQDIYSSIAVVLLSHFSRE